MLVMISQPMNGLSDDEINKTRKDLIEKFNKLHIDVTNTLFDYNTDKYSNSGVFYLGKSLEAMANVDAVYFAKDWQNARGCRIERQIAKEYGIKILDTDFLYEEATVKRIIPEQN